MQRYFTYGRKRRKAPDVSDVRLPGAARQMDAKRQRKTVIAILIAIKTMLHFFCAGIIYRDIRIENVKAAEIWKRT